MDEKISQIVRLFSENENATEALKNTKTKEEAVAVLGQFGVEITVGEFIEIAKEINNDEISEEMLMLVSGGSWSGFWRGVRDFFQGFLDAF